MKSIARFEADRTSGAAELARRALEILQRARARGESRRRLERLADRLSRAHPAMGAVWNAVHSKHPATYGRLLERAPQEAARNARKLLPRRARVLTLSYSSTVVATLSRRDLSVIVAESLPGGEAKKTARLLRKAGVQVEVVRDAAMARALESAHVAIVGADAVTPKVVINKVGTRLLALAARELRKKCYVVADRSKLVPATWPLPEFDEASWFEATPRRLFTRIITDET